MYIHVSDRPHPLTAPPPPPTHAKFFAVDTYPSPSLDSPPPPTLSKVALDIPPCPSHRLPLAQPQTPSPKPQIPCPLLPTPSLLAASHSLLRNRHPVPRCTKSDLYHVKRKLFSVNITRTFLCIAVILWHAAVVRNWRSEGQFSRMLRSVYTYRLRHSHLQIYIDGKNRFRTQFVHQTVSHH